MMVGQETDSSSNGALSTWYFKPWGVLEPVSSAAPWAIFPRKKLDIGYTDFFSTCLSLLVSNEDSRSATSLRIQSHWPTCNVLVTLSVRTAFDTFLSLMKFPPGSEIIVSAITIPDMIFLIKAHQLVIVPVDLDRKTLRPISPLPITKKTKAVLIAHVFGTYNDIAPIINQVKAHSQRIYVIEDCAQAYSGTCNTINRDNNADLVMYSFGTIKTSTALGGALTLVKDPELFHLLQNRVSKFPIRSTKIFVSKVLKYAIAHGVTSPAIYGLILHLCQKLSWDHDAILTAITRGFKGGELQSLIRYQPSLPLLKLLDRRLREENSCRSTVSRYVEARQERSRLLKSLLKPAEHLLEMPGSDAQLHYYWLFPVKLLHGVNRLEVAKQMLHEGFDVTSGATQLTWVPSSSNNIETSIPKEAKDIMEHLVYLPITPECSSAVIKSMATSLIRILNKSKI